jgi:hypothetical protein
LSAPKNRLEFTEPLYLFFPEQINYSHTDLISSLYPSPFSAFHYYLSLWLVYWDGWLGLVQQDPGAWAFALK